MDDGQVLVVLADGNNDNRCMQKQCGSVLFISTSSPWSRDQSQEHKTQLSVTPRVVIQSSKFSYLMTVMMIFNCAAVANVMTLHVKNVTDK